MKKLVLLFFLLSWCGIRHAWASSPGSPFPDSLAVSVDSIHNPTCLGGSDGTVFITITGGTSPYTVLWSDGETAEDLVNRISGYYGVTVTDADSSTVSLDSIWLAQPINPVSAALLFLEHPGCTGQLGSLAVATSGDAPPFDLAWSNGATTDTLNDLTAGTYDLVLTDTNGCTAEYSLVLEPQYPNVVLTADGQINCDHPMVLLDGSATDLGINSVFAWSTSNGGELLPPTDGLIVTTAAAGTYTLSITDTLNGCVSLAEITITADTIQPDADAGLDLLLACTNSVDTLFATASDGGNFTYEWEAYDGGNIVAGGDSLNLIINHAGLYVFTVTNTENNCVTTDTVLVEGTNAPPLLSVEGDTLTCQVTEVQLLAQLDTANISFGWTGPNGFTSDELNPIVQTAGEYHFTATDTLTTCTSEAIAVVLGDDDTPVLTVTGGALTCVNDSITLAFTSSIPEVVFNWTGPNGFTSDEQNPVVSEAGDYVLTVNDTLTGCSATAIASVTTDTLAPIADAGADTTLTCTVASLQLDGSGSSQGAEFSYAWTTIDGNITVGADSLAPTVDAIGTYTLTVTNTSNGCTDDDDITIGEDVDAPDVVANGGTLTCIVTSVELEGNVVGDNVTYEWTGPNGFTSDELNPTVTEPGDYTLTVVDTLNGCTAAATAIVVADTIQPDLEVAGGSINCVQSQVTLVASSQAPNVDYEWQGPNGFTFIGPEAIVDQTGDYTVTATDTLNGCTSTVVFTVGIDTVPPIADAGAGLNLDCNVTSGQLNGSGSSQGAEFTYAWTTADGNITAGADSTTPTVDTTGTYTLTVTNTSNGCSATASVTVTQSTSVTADVTTTDATCSGSASGSASVSASGGVGNYTYLWSNGSLDATATNLTAGVYSVTVSDTEGCSTVATGTIGQPAALNIAISTTPQGFPGMNDGIASASVSGGTAPYTYAWSNGESTDTIFNLLPGAYIVTVTDDNGCSAIATANVNAFDCQLTGSIAVLNATCFGSSTGEATVTLSNEIAPVTFAWSNGDSLATAGDLAAGIYSVTVTDSTSCSLVFNFEVTQSAELLVSELLHTDIFCASDSTGSITAAVNGGVQPYTFVWSNGSTEATANDLAVGDYTLTVTDANGCEATLTASISATDTESPVLVLTDLTVSLDNSGELIVNAEAYDAGSTDNCGIVSWTVSQSQFGCGEIGTQFVTVTATDASGNETSGVAEITIEDTTAPTLTCPPNQSVGACNATVVFDLPTLSDNCTFDISFMTQTAGLPSGSDFPLGTTVQTFEYTDGSGNTGTCSFEVTVADEMSFTAVLSDASCNGVCDGGVGLTVSGGLQPVTVVWSNGGDGSGLCAGNYTVIVTDADGCSATLEFTVGEPDALEISLTSTNPVCPDDLTGTIEAAVTGGTSPYTFDWEDGSTEDTLTGLGAGVFNLTVTDFRGCSLSEVVTLVASDDEAPTLVLQNVSVVLGANGSVSIAPALFDAGSTDNCGIVSWSVAPTSFECDELGQHIVTLTATDASGNSNTSTTTVTVSDSIAPTLTCPANITLGHCNTTASFALPVATDNCAVNLVNLTQTSGLASGSNFPSGVTVQSFNYTDAAGNEATCTFNVTVFDAANITPTSTNATCNGLCNGSATMTLTGGISPFNIVWSNGQTGPTVINLCAGAYSASVTDAAGCLQTLTYNISEPLALQFTVDQVTDDLHGTGVGAVQVSISGGTTPYSYSWTRNGQPFATTQDLAGLNAGTYALVVTDGNGCTIQSSNIVVDNLTGTEEPTWSQAAVLQPNPASGFTQILFKNPLVESLEVQVFDVAGHLMSQQIYQNNTSAIKLDLTGLASGVYHVKMQSAGGVAMRRLVVTQ